MKHIKKLLYLLLIALNFILPSCQEKDDNNNTISNTEISRWVYEWMYDLYLWYDKMPIIKNFSTKTDPESFFYNELVYKQEDRWSYITSNFTALEAELIKGTPKSMGFYPIFGIYGNNNVAIVIAYVYPNSPAYRSGLKRGDIITKINGNSLTQNNYYELYSLESYKATISKYDGNSFQDVKEVDLQAEIIEADPLIFDTIFNINNNKIGYLAYVQFINGENNKYKNHLNNVLQKFKSENITSIIIDLRYNPGGEIENALFLASSLAPAEVVNNKEVFIKFNYNDKFQKYIIDEEGPESDNLILKFDNNVQNININKIYFLTSNQTASASELIIIGLKPYLKNNLKIVGNNTHGKYVGSFIIYDFQNKPRKHDWAIMPVVLKYSNVEDYTGFKDGLTPDIEISDSLLNLRNFGDTLDPFISTCFNDLRGETELLVTKTKGKILQINTLENPDYKAKSNLIIKKLIK